MLLVIILGIQLRQASDVEQVHDAQNVASNHRGDVGAYQFRELTSLVEFVEFAA